MAAALDEMTVAAKEIPNAVADVTAKFDAIPAQAALVLAICTEGHARMTKGRIHQRDASKIADQLRQAATLYEQFAAGRGTH